MHNIKLSKLIYDLQEYFSQIDCKTSSAIAKKTGVNQSQVYRNLFGNPKRFTKTHLELCKYANISPLIENKDPSTSIPLMNALKFVWNGTDEHAIQLAELLLAHHKACVGQSLINVRAQVKRG